MRAQYTSILGPLVLGLLTCSASARAQSDIRRPVEPSPGVTNQPVGPRPTPAPAPAPSEEPPGEEMPVEEEVVTVDPKRPPAPGKGGVWGVVKTQGGETALEAVVTVIGRSEKGTTDMDGQYRLDLPPGTYQLRVKYELQRIARVKNVRVAAGKILRVDVLLVPDSTAVEEFTAVEAEVERASSATQLFLRKNAAQASDSVGAQDIAKTPDRNAAEAVKRVVGTTVVDGRYLFIRGLGDRYTNTLMNGSPLPSPEPDRQAVPLDMFPALVLADLTVSKTFVPDMPGDFTGGSLNIHTRELPNKFLFQTTLGVGANTQSTFGKRLSYPGGKLDWLGIDDGKRKLPQAVPGALVTKRSVNLTDVGRAMASPMETDRTVNLPNGNLSGVIGDSFKLGKERVFGYMAGFTYSRRFQVRQDEIIRTYNPDVQNPGQLAKLNDYRAETGLDTVTWSGLGTVTYAFDNDHKVSLTGLYSRNAEKEGRVLIGQNEEQNNIIRDERIRFVNRNLVYGQLRGDHRFRKLGNAAAQWTALYARAQLSDPNLRENVYGDDPLLGSTFRESNLSGQHFYAAQSETTRSGSLDWTQPLVEGDAPTKLKVGGMVTLRGRSFNARRFRYLRINGADEAIFAQRPDQLFAPDNVGSAIELREWTSPTDAYVAQYNVYAAYAMADIGITSRLRVVAGERLEVSRQIIQSFFPLTAEPQLAESTLNRTDLLPSANIIYKLTAATNVRLSATRTVARPQLRELAPFIFTDFFGAREMFGNPKLDRTNVLNLDARFELFPRVGEVLALSLFHKRFTKPIETTIIPTNRGVVSYQNAKGAVNTGVELEARKGLDFISTRLKELTLLANLTLVHSRVDLDTSQVGVQTTNSRPLSGQSPYVVNFALDWNHEASKTRVRALYNVFGKRIAQVGSNGLPDMYEQPRHVVDLSAAQGIGEHVDLKFTVENVLNAPVRFTQGEDDGFIANRYLLGQTVWLSLTYTN